MFLFLCTYMCSCIVDLLPLPFIIYDNEIEFKDKTFVFNLANLGFMVPLKVEVTQDDVKFLIFSHVLQ